MKTVTVWIETAAAGTKHIDIEQFVELVVPVIVVSVVAEATPEIVSLEVPIVTEVVPVVEVVVPVSIVLLATVELCTPASWLKLSLKKSPTFSVVEEEVVASVGGIMIPSSFFSDSSWDLFPDRSSSNPESGISESLVGGWCILWNRNHFHTHT